MIIGTGIALAFVAMLCWGFGDFWIQRSARRLGDWETLFAICAFGAAVLLPFVWRSLPGLIFADPAGLGMLLLASAVLFVAALLDLESLRRGKLAIVEPIWSFEIVAAAVLSYFVLGERVGALQAVLIMLLMIGLMLTAFRSRRLTRSLLLEKGAGMALLAAIVMGSAGFLMGWGARLTDPVTTNFVTDAILALGAGLFLAMRGRFGRTLSDIGRNYALLLPMSIADKAAWLAYTFSMSLAPIAIATAFSESYIIITVLLGLLVNKEKLYAHQKAGLVGAVLAAVLLAATTQA